jgi:hypothetical protein
VCVVSANKIILKRFGEVPAEDALMGDTLSVEKISI